MDIRNLTLNDVIRMGELLGGQDEFIGEMQRIAGILHIMGKTEDPLYRIEEVYEMTVGQLQDEYVNKAKPQAGGVPKTRAKAAKVGR